MLHDREAWDAVWTTVARGEPLERPVELMARRKDGSATFLEVSASGWESDKRIFVTAILRDVNERRAVEDALRQLNQTLEERVAERTAERDRMWRLSTDVMLVARLDGTIISVNPAWRSQFGWDEAALIGVKLAEFVVPEDRAGLQTRSTSWRPGGRRGFSNCGCRIARAKFGRSHGTPWPSTRYCRRSDAT